MKALKIALASTALLALLGVAIHYTETASADPVVASQQQHQVAHRVQYTAKFVCGNVSDILQDYPVVPGYYRTSINVRNNTESEVFVDKHISLVYSDLGPLGREPNFSGDQWQDNINLPPHSTTMDDCMRIYQLTGIPVGVFIEGYLELNVFQNATRELPGLVVDAVYTATPLEEPYTPSIDVQRIPNDYVM